MKRPPRNGVSGNLVVTLYFITKAIPMAISAGAIYLGYKLFVLGVTGEASIAVHANTVKGQLLNAAPGLFFAVGGIVSLIISVWKGSSFTFSRQDPFEILSMCLPRYGSRWGEALEEQAVEGPDK